MSSSRLRRLERLKRVKLRNWRSVVKEVAVGYVGICDGWCGAFALLWTLLLKISVFVHYDRFISSQYMILGC
jgi:hypothetical protein